MKLEAIINQPTIETERFTLRPVRKSDAGLLQMYAGEEQVARMTPSLPHPLAPAIVENMITRAMSNERDVDVWVMDGVKSGHPEFMGMISLDRLERDQSEVSYWVAQPFWNTGLASEAVRAIVEANPMNNKTMFAAVFQDNPASARVLTNCGFSYLGDAETYCVARKAKLATWTYLKKLV